MALFQLTATTNKPTPHTIQNYCPHVDGLRAIAILLVVIYHAFPSVLGGGFVGVDVFFVISGYLITRIILTDLYNNSFSFSAFYKRRVLRIFPALLLVLVTCLIIGWFYILPYEYSRIGSHVLGGAGFVSNFILWAEHGYFDIASEAKPLLHLWSLGIEEQFYILYPIMLWVLWKQRLNIFLFILAISILSFTWNIAWHKSDPVATFYSPQTRAWELMIGCLVALRRFHIMEYYQTLKVRLQQLVSFRTPDIFAPLLSSQLVANLLPMFALFLILFAAFRVSNQTFFPGWWAIFPTLGTALLIIARDDSWVLDNFLSSKPVVWMGLISYPLYLWHWPLLSFSQIIVGETPHWGIRVGLCLIAVLLAWLTYRLIEAPIRHGRPRAIIVHGLIALMIVVGLFGYIIYASGGVQSRASLSHIRFPAMDVQSLNSYVWANKRKFDAKPFDRAGKKVLVIGDSYSGDFINALLKSEFANNVQISSFTIRGGCGNVLTKQDIKSFRNPRTFCPESENLKNPEFISLMEKADVIVFASTWFDWEVDLMRESIQNLKSLSKASILFVGAKQLGGLTTELIDLSMKELREKKHKTSPDILAINRKIEQTLEKEQFFDVQRALCGNSSECPYINEQGLIVSYDGVHLTPDGARILGDHLSRDTQLQKLFN